MTRWMEVRRDGPIATITIDRPEVLNVLNGALVDGIVAELTSLGVDDDIRALVITGSGSRSFVAGADIAQFQTATPAISERLARRTKQMHDAIQLCPKPVIAAVNGYCFGAGFELALACDIRIAASTATFALPEIKLGILPGGGGTVRLSRLAGASVARAMALTGETITAERAYQLGVVHSLHEPGNLREASDRLASQLASYSPFAIAQLKAVLDAAASQDAESAYTTEIKGFALCFSSEDQKEGARAFLEKRPPRFLGR